MAAVRVLHLDHVGAEIGQDQRRRRPGHDMAELEDLKTREGREEGETGMSGSARFSGTRRLDCASYQTELSKQ